jgi:hypothetical protein
VKYKSNHFWGETKNNGELRERRGEISGLKNAILYKIKKRKRNLTNTGNATLHDSIKKRSNELKKLCCIRFIKKRSAE